METTQKMPGKGKLVTYWIFTGLFTLGMFSSGLQQIFRQKDMAAMVGALGYPMYFMTIIGVWKILGVIAVLLPGFKMVKEWAYAGFFFTMTGALVSHLAVGDYAIKAMLGPLFQAIFIVLSWYFRPESRKVAES
ncbi:MAG TPA: DoxX family protein [Bacteroidia bacterium]|nr:DoxX family protein [Bacteroidia bacterium]